MNGEVVLKVRSTITDRVYDPMEMVYLENPKQIARYIKHGATLYDLMESRDILIGVFSKRETLGLYDLWRKHELA